MPAFVYDPSKDDEDIISDKDLKKIMKKHFFNADDLMNEWLNQNEESKNDS